MNASRPRNNHALSATLVLALAIAGTASAVESHFQVSHGGRKLPASCVAREGTEVESTPDALVVRNLGTFGYPGVEIRPAEGEGTWDWSNVGEVAVVVSNGSDRADYIRAGVVGEGMSLDVAPTRSSLVPGHAVRTILIPIADSPYMTDEPVELKGMQGRIGSAATRLDFSRTKAVFVFQIFPGDSLRTTEFAVLGVGAFHPARVPQVIPAAEFFPFVDKYGQFKHGDWPGKIHSDEDFAAQRAAEEAWLKANANGPIPDADKYGGWAGGPQLEATGFFRTEKVDGKWWFVDPDGHLFFSLGIDSIFPGYPTLVSGRETYFEDAAPGSGSVSFGWTNLQRKYGADWKARFNDMVHTRFKAWGINTLGNWCWNGGVWWRRRTPYCLCIDFSSRTVIPGWRPCNGRAIPDVYSEKFASDLTERVRGFAAHMRDDPWCLGVFVDNELGFQGCASNVAEVAEKYYSTVRSVLKRELPNHLYLGSRLHILQPESAWRAAARHCDVVSHNFYELEPSFDLPPDSPDKPMLMGEFHFGAKDRGHFLGGCVPVFDQDERGRCFRYFVETCLDKPRFIGCHWFEYYDQPFVGRGGGSDDSENFNDGFVSICDVPHPEMVEAARAVAAEMYGRRFGATPANSKPGVFQPSERNSK